MRELAILILVLFLGSCSDVNAGNRYSYQQRCEYQHESGLTLCVNSYDRCYIGNGVPSCVSILR